MKLGTSFNIPELLSCVERMGKTGTTRAKMKYRCMATGCQVTPRGCDIMVHYRTKTNWDLVAKMKAAVGDAALERLKGEADPHSLFIFMRGYSRTRLPVFATHVCVKEGTEEVEERALQQKQHSLTRFMQVWDGLIQD